MTRIKKPVIFQSPVFSYLVEVSAGELRPDEAPLRQQRTPIT
jgi:hypothetical protein